MVPCAEWVTILVILIFNLDYTITTLGIMNPKHDDAAEVDEVDEVARIEDLQNVESTRKDLMIDQDHSALYLEAIQRYPVDDATRLH